MIHCKLRYTGFAGKWWKQWCERTRTASKWIKRHNAKIYWRSFYVVPAAKVNTSAKCGTKLQTHPCGDTVYGHTSPQGVTQGHSGNCGQRIQFPAQSAFLDTRGSRICKVPPVLRCSRDGRAQGHGALKKSNKGILQPGVLKSHTLHQHLPSTTLAHYEVTEKLLTAFFRKGEREHKSYASKQNILQVSKLRLENTKQPVQGYTAKELQNWNSLQVGQTLVTWLLIPHPQMGLRRGYVGGVTKRWLLSPPKSGHASATYPRRLSPLPLNHDTWGWGLGLSLATHPGAIPEVPSPFIHSARTPAPRSEMLIIFWAQMWLDFLPVLVPHSPPNASSQVPDLSSNPISSKTRISLKSPRLVPPRAWSGAPFSGFWTSRKPLW